MSPTFTTSLLVTLGVLLAVSIVVLIGLCTLWLDARLRAARELRRSREYRDVNGHDAVQSWLDSTDWQQLRPSNGSPWRGEDEAVS